MAYQVLPVSSHCLQLSGPPSLRQLRQSLDPHRSRCRQPWQPSWKGGGCRWFLKDVSCIWLIPTVQRLTLGSMLEDAENWNGPSSSLCLRQMVSNSVFGHIWIWVQYKVCILDDNNMVFFHTGTKSVVYMAWITFSCCVFSFAGDRWSSTVPIMNRVSIRVCQTLCTALQIMKQ